MESIPSNRNFSFIWLASLLSGIGDSIMSIAVLWAVYSLTESPIALGVVTVAQLLPIIIFSFYSGVLADLHSTKKIMIYSDIARFLCLMLLIFVWLYNSNGRLLFLYIIIFFLSAFSSFFDPSFQTTVKKIVKKDKLMHANSWFQFSRNFSRLFGLVLGGVLVSAVGVQNAFIINALSFLLSALLLYFSNIPHEKEALVSKKISDHLRDAFNYLRNAPSTVKQSLWYIVIINFSVAPLSIIMTLLANKGGYGSFGLGILNAALALGSILGAFLAPRIEKKFNNTSVIFYFITFYCVFIFLATCFSNLHAGSLFFFLSGIFSSLTLIFVNTFMQRDIDMNFIGKISSFRSMALRIPPPIITLIYGWVVTGMGLMMSTLAIQVITLSLCLIIKIKYRDRRIKECLMKRSSSTK
ncbi:MFS transporter [Rummeliibacillus suwonensis]|uniref:MFS transporter n=1 Tax=Rummeliibacillus suwonensis TaxID=1306154 RepID=UPI001AAF52FB|nr:MFS transporter [Rummeliibacillus suwonensis]MBO2536171.1 MFS transporter [Rummeliibacillus suwonensis]